MSGRPRSAGEWSQAIHAAFMKESDRACAIVAGAMLDDALLRLLRTRLLPPADKRQSVLEGGTAPLGTFSARIDAAYQFGLISEYLCRDLHIIRGIRNDFAHEPLDTSFATQSISDRISVLEKSSDYNTRHPETRAAMGPAGKKGDFLGIVAWILYTLQCDVEETKPVKPRVPEFGYIRWEDLPPEVRQLLEQEARAKRNST